MIITEKKFIIYLKIAAYGFVAFPFLILIAGILPWFGTPREPFEQADVYVVSFIMDFALLGILLGWLQVLMFLRRRGKLLNKIFKLKSDKHE